MHLITNALAKPYGAWKLLLTTFNSSNVVTNVFVENNHLMQSSPSADKSASWKSTVYLPITYNLNY